ATPQLRTALPTPSIVKSRYTCRAEALGVYLWHEQGHTAGVEITWADADNHPFRDDLRIEEDQGLGKLCTWGWHVHQIIAITTWINANRATTRYVHLVERGEIPSIPAHSSDPAEQENRGANQIIRKY
uniref:hypothetical protein n=1 Tax=Kocuria marina TaxID=223184 RepID=UPI0022E5860B